MDKAEKKPDALRRWILFGFYAGMGCAFLKFVFTDVFSMSGPLADSLSFLVTFSVAFLLFGRGIENPWTRDKRPWTFLPWFIIDLVITFASYWAARYFQWK